jgi:hypothetical protein
LFQRFDLRLSDRFFSLAVFLALERCQSFVTLCKSFGQAQVDLIGSAAQQQSHFGFVPLLVENGFVSFHRHDRELFLQAVNPSFSTAARVTSRSQSQVIQL